MITNKLKDRILTDLVSNGIEVQLDIHAYARQLNCSFEMIDAILSHFERRNLITAHRAMGGHVMIFVNVEAHDMVRLGGFTAQEELLKKNIEKLLLEIESLKPSMPDKIEKIAGIAANIATALTLFIPGK